MYEPERLKALEKLMVEVLRINPQALAEISAKADVPDQFLFLPGEEDTEEARAVQLHRTGVRAAKNQLITRALYPEGGPLADDDLDEFPEGVETIMEDRSEDFRAWLEMRGDSDKTAPLNFEEFYAWSDERRAARVTEQAEAVA